MEKKFTQKELMVTPANAGSDQAIYYYVETVEGQNFLAMVHENAAIGVSLEEAKANAILFSAASQLLEALEDVRQVLILCTLIDKSGQAKEAVEVCDKAIKKAYGA